MNPAAITGWRQTALHCIRAADWLDNVAAGRPVDDNGPIPLDLARNVPARLLHQWANNERATAMNLRRTANNLANNLANNRRTRP